MRTADAEPIEPGSTVGNLVVERELGRGAFGIVYLARDQILRRPVALKTIVRSDLELAPEAIESFLDEARVVARLNSPNVVTLYQLHERPDGHWMLEMEYVEGSTLRERIEEAGGVSMDSVERLLRGITVGLKAAHDAGVLHRDIKPANVLVAEDGTAKLTDFGLARVVTDESIRLERGDDLVGTPSYMAPEILQGSAATVASDLWSLGVMAYQLLAGRRPFEAKNLASFFFEVQNSPAAPLAPVVDPRLKQFVARCLEKDPADRVPSCAELIEILDGPAVAAPERVAERPVAPARERVFGRSAELAHFGSVLDRVEAGASTGLLVVGDGGVGKSMLLDAVSRTARDRGFVWLTATLSPFEGPLQTLVEAVHASTRTERSWRTAAFGPASGIVAKLLRGEAVPELDKPEQAVWALEHLFRGVATERPLCLCIEETRHAREEDVALLSDLIRRLADSRFLITLTARPEAPILAQFAELPNIERLTLAGLSGEALYAFLEDSIGSVSIPPEVANRIWIRSDGNPLLASEILRHMEEQGTLAHNGDRVEVRAGWDSDSVPQRLHHLVAARLENLDEEDRALLEVAAVDGREFDGRALAAIAEMPLIQVLRRLQKLCRSKMLIEPSEDGYRFANSFLQQVLYEDMAPELQRELHRALATHLEERDDERNAERLVRHWEGCGEQEKARPYLLAAAAGAALLGGGGGELEKARPYLLAAAAGAASRQENHRLVEFCQRAGLLSESLDPEYAADNGPLAITLGRELGRNGRHEETARLLDAVRRGAEARGDRELDLQAELQQAILLRSTGATSQVDQDRVRELAGLLGRSTYAGNAHHLLGTIAKHCGDLEAAAESFRKARELFEAVGSDVGEVIALDGLGSVALRSDRMQEAAQLFAEASERAARIGLVTNAAVSGVNRVAVDLALGRMEGLTTILERAIRTFELTGNSHYAAHVWCTLADVRYAEGDVSGARQAADHAIPRLRETKHHLALAYALRIQGCLLAAAGDLGEAENKLAEARDLVEQALEYGQQAIAWVGLAQVKCMAGDAEAAADAARRGLEANSSTPRAAGDVLLAIGEAGVYGLAPEVLAEAAAVIPDDERDSAHALMLEAVRAYADPGSGSAPLFAAAVALRTQPIGVRRALMRIIADRFEVEALRRDGDTAGAKDVARRGLDAAKALDHVWLAAGFERALAR